MCLNNTVKLVYYAGEHGYSEYRITQSFYESPVKFFKHLCKLIEYIEFTDKAN